MGSHGAPPIGPPSSVDSLPSVSPAPVLVPSSDSLPLPSPVVEPSSSLSPFVALGSSVGSLGSSVGSSSVGSLGPSSLSSSSVGSLGASSAWSSSDGAVAPGSPSSSSAGAVASLVLASSKSPMSSGVPQALLVIATTTANRIRARVV